jgi:photosystem II stability/assembly factor-like uncharacterized protein
MRKFAGLWPVLLVGVATAQFTLQDAKTTSSLRGVSAVSAQVAWASGSAGTVVRTTDGGANWKPCAVPPGGQTLDFRGVQAFDADSALVMASGTGKQSAIFRTTDGCASWKLVLANPDADGFFDALVMTDWQHGWLLGDPVGDHFTVQSFAEEGDGPLHVSPEESATLQAGGKNHGAFAASNTSFFVLDKAVRTYLGPPPPKGAKPAFSLYPEEWFATGGAAGAFVYTHQVPSGDVMTPGKLDWVKSPVPVGAATAASGVFSICFAHRPSSKAPVGVAVGGDYTAAQGSQRTAAYSTDGGAHWTASSTMPHGYRSAVAFDPATRTWLAVGPNGADVSHDDGKTWTPLKPGKDEATDADQRWNAISLPFLVGEKGKIGRVDLSKAGK